jgi:predicted DNA-binding transcriptional regulator YafY
VADAGTWHLVCHGDGRLRVYRVSRLCEVAILEEGFDRPADFDLAAWWRHRSLERKRAARRYTAIVRVSSVLTNEIERRPGAERLEETSAAGSEDGNDQITWRLRFESFEEARRQVLAFGGAAEVVGPSALREGVLDFAKQTVAVYSDER